MLFRSGRIASGEHGVDEAVHVVALAPGVSVVRMMISAMVSTLSSAFPASILNAYRRGHSALSKRPIQISKVVPPISTSEGFVQPVPDGTSRMTHSGPRRDGCAKLLGTHQCASQGLCGRIIVNAPALQFFSGPAT